MTGLPCTDQRAAANAVVRGELPRLTRAADMLRASVEAVAWQTSPSAVAGAMAVHTARMTQADRVLVGWIEDDEFHPRAVAESGRLIDGVRLADWEADAVTAVRRTQRPAVWPDHIGVPAVDHHGRVRAIVVAFKKSGFTAVDVRQVETLTLAAAVAADRGRLFERLIDWNRSMEMLLAFNAAINQHLAPPVLVRRLVEQAAQLLNADAGFAGLAVPDGHGGVVMEADGYWCHGVWHDGRRCWQRGDGTPGFVLETEFPYFSNDYPTDPLADADRVGVRRAMCVPIKNDRQQVLGFFELHRGAGDLFTWHDAAFLESLANIAAVAVENAGLWRSLEESNRQLQAMSAANARRLEEERRHIARELHDETGQALIGIKLGLQALAGLVPDELADVRAELDLLKQQVNDAAVRIKELSRQLRPPTLDHCGLPAALRQLAEDFRRRTGLRAEIDAVELPRRFAQPVETALYRIAQEALTNTAKHAGARTVRLILELSDDELRFAVVDDGCGFDPTAATTGLGLLGMRERIDILGGQFRLTSGPTGTTIDVRIRVNNAEPA